MNMIITVGGLAGTGTSTVSRMISDRLNLDYLYAGDVFRKEAAKRNMSLLEFGRLAEEDHDIDIKLDNMVKDIATKGDILVEGRIAARVLDEMKPIKIWFECDDEIRFERVAHRDGITVKDAKERTLEREKSERKRYMEIYGFDYMKLSQYDIIIDTSYIGPEDIAEQIIDAVLHLSTQTG